MMGGRSLRFWLVAPVVLVALGCRGSNSSVSHPDRRPAPSAQPDEPDPSIRPAESAPPAQAAQPNEPSEPPAAAEATEAAEAPEAAEAAETVRPVHVCIRACDHHFYDGSKLVAIEGTHHHRPGCGHGWDGRHWVRVYPGPTRPRGHRCTPDCHDHYSDGNKLILIGGHHHSQGCGHLWDGQHWLLVRTGPALAVEPTPVPVRGIHVCTRACHEHFWDGSQLMLLTGHHHGAGCGHSWDGQHWVAVKKENAKPSQEIILSPRPAKSKPIDPRP